MTVKKILITAGGTGGHLFPAQALAQQLSKKSTPCEVLFVAGGLNSNRFFDREQFRYQEIPCSPLLSRNPLKVLNGLKNLVKGACQSCSILKEFKPDAVVGFGSFYTVPVLLAAKWLKIPIILHEANSVPGKANKWLASLADTVALHFPSSARFFKGKTVEVGLPLRNGYRLGAISREEALAYYGLPHSRPTLLICGGSQGARGINALIEGAIKDLQKLGLQIIHLTGDPKSAEKLAALYQASNIPSSVKPFENQMQMAFSAADAFIGRSGASTIAESLEFEVPGLLIPYPHATDNHQEKNADFLVNDVGSAWKIIEGKLSQKEFGQALERFFEERQISAFKKALQDYKKRPQQKTLCELVFELSNPINAR